MSCTGSAKAEVYDMENKGLDLERYAAFFAQGGEDSSALLCALYIEAGYDAAMGGKGGHVFAGVSFEGFREVSGDRLDGLGVGYLILMKHPAVDDPDGTVYYAVDTTRGQTPVGYTTWINFGDRTAWGTVGFYPVSQGDVSGIHSPS